MQDIKENVGYAQKAEKENEKIKDNKFKAAIRKLDNSKLLRNVTIQMIGHTKNY